MLCLGIETSCDETSIALTTDRSVIADCTYSQEIHSRFGGVVPETASRHHLAKIDLLCAAAFEKAQVSPEQVDLIAVTDTPGLAGALLVGVSFALGLHSAFGSPITGINHLEGHISAVLVEYPDIEYPFLALVVSGGHTSLYVVKEFGSYECLGRTVDDAAGEAFDKIGKMLGFSYPAGRRIEQEARDASEVKRDLFRFPQGRMSGYDFSFSGLKTAVRYFLNDKPSEYVLENRASICHAFQKSIVTTLATTVHRAMNDCDIPRIAVVGGVACNQALRKAMYATCGDLVYFPSPHYCTDNAVMIARAGLERASRNLLRPVRMDPAGRLY